LDGFVSLFRIVNRDYFSGHLTHNTTGFFVALDGDGLH